MADDRNDYASLMPKHTCTTDHVNICERCVEDKLAANISIKTPAQSDAPSAEEIAMKKNLAERDAENFLYDRLGFAFKAVNSSLTVTIFRPEFKIFSFSQYDGKWDVVYLMDKAWELLMELAAKVAQLEREREVLRRTLALPETDLGKLTSREEIRSELITEGFKAAAALSEARERASLIPLACQMAVLAHADQLDHCGKSAVLHVFHVGFAMSSDTDMIVGLLHDSVEDAGCSLDSIRSIFGDEVADAVNAITHPKHEPYSDYLNRVMQNSIAHRVKIVDATHNLSRADAIQDETLKRRLKTKFTNALSRLGASGAAGTK